MKKLRIGLSCLLILLLLAPTGALAAKDPALPEKILEWVVEDYFRENGEPDDYDYTVIHDPDEPTHTDTVTIDLTVTYPRYTAVTSYWATYQYDKSSDLWSLLRGGQWAPLRAESYALSSDGEEWMALLDAAFDMDHIELEPGYSGRDFLEEFDSEDLTGAVRDGWLIEGWADDDKPVEFDMQVGCALFADRDSAAQFFARLKDFCGKTWEMSPLKSVEGDSLRYDRFAGDDCEYADLILLDDAVYLLYTDVEDPDMPVKLLSAVGFLPPA